MSLGTDSKDVDVMIKFSMLPVRVWPQRRPATNWFMFGLQTNRCPKLGAHQGCAMACQSHLREINWKYLINQLNKLYELSLSLIMSNVELIDCRGN